ncbi:MAG TPA: hypothetical protein VD861_01435 [Pyrinomonadaceae bacterium]|nr:hypothetical protein [Pyrinomonadaceae bacterium]
MSTISEEKLGQICDDVWRDRAAILARCGLLNDEDALARALYWRIRKAGGDPGRDVSAYARLLNKLAWRCRAEAGRGGQGL